MAYKTVPLNESQVGKYVDIDGDGIPEGVIFADLAVGGEGQWGNEYFKEKYKIPTIEDGLKKNHYNMCREWPYKDLRPRIIAEELISDNPPDDYKFFMFHGKMDSVMVCTERATGHPKFRFYDQDWNRLYYQKTDREPATDVRMPANFLEMIKVAETLSTGFVHVRVDLYNVNEHVYFGELTLYDNGGFDLDITYETDLLWGRKMDLSCVSDNYASNKDKGVE